nr:MAG TPA: hypothetical protein [Caudoviricetes sp.]
MKLYDVNIISHISTIVYVIVKTLFNDSFVYSWNQPR